MRDSRPWTLNIWWALDPEELVFATTTGKPIGASNLRRRVLAPAIKLAAERLTEAGSAPLPAGLTPHSRRRTFASVLYALSETSAGRDGCDGAHNARARACDLHAGDGVRTGPARGAARARQRDGLGTRWAPGQF